LICLFIHALAGCAIGAFAGERPPSVLFLFIEDQRQDTIHAWGDAHIRTPNMDRLVKNGVSFHNA
jgi:arylsulfatase A-like enzyme